MLQARKLLLAMVVSAAGIGGACGFLENRFKSCEDVRVDLVNDDQTLGPFHILAEDERPSDETLLPSGATRRINQCLDVGYRKRFRAFTPDDLSHPVGDVNCGAGKSSYDTIVARVRWTPVGFRCENW
jgi:hypothetical protein